MTTNPDEYNGWTNRETWAVNLWLPELGIDPADLYEEGMADYALGDALEALIRDLLDDAQDDPAAWHNLAGFVADCGSLWRVNWREIARHYLPTPAAPEATP